MTDINAQLEANGLPKSFESTSNQPEVVHATINDAATMSNSEIIDMKQQAPNLETAILNKPVQPPDVMAVVDAQPSSVAPVLDAQPSSEIPEIPEIPEKINGHEPPLESSLSEPEPGPAPPLDDAPSSVPHSEVAEAIPESTTDAANIITSEAITQPDQAPMSDLRTAPHSDALAPEEVAQIEAEKHALDNAAVPVSAAVDPLPSPPPVVEAPVLKNSGLPSPPHQQSPPPAPQPEHAQLPVTTELNPPTDPSEVNLIGEVNIPSETPVEPAPTPVVPPPQESQDHEMTDSPVTYVKPSREREEDIEMGMDEPVAKRLKTEEDHVMTEAADFKVPDAPTTASSEHPAPTDSDDVVTPSRLQHMKKVISNLKKSNASTSFRVPVDPVALNIPTYLDVVKRPMDLSTIDSKLKRNEYTSVRAFVDDFDQILKNCIAFNGAEHTVTQQGRKMDTSFKNQMQNLPSANIVEPSRAEKKAAKPKIEPVRSAPRRSSVNAKAVSPNAVSPATFAPDPNGMPLIRRDSSTVDGRPKRAIIPTKRNSDFAGGRPKKKKYELELRFCEEILKTITSAKHWQMNQYFTHAVDPVALNIPTYYQIIKKPMDLGTVRQKLDGGLYEKAKDFEEDVRLIFKNCYKFNVEGDLVYRAGQDLEKLFSQEWAKKTDWIHAREPDSEPASVADDDEEEDESDEEDDEPDDDNEAKISALKAQIAAMAEQVGELSKKKKKKSTPPTGSKKSKDKKKKEHKSSSNFPNLGKSKEKKSKSSATAKGSKQEKERYVTFAEKQYISNGIAMLPERQLQEALRIIQSSVPSLANSDQNEIELDIEEVPNHALLKLLAHVKRYAGPPPEEVKNESTASVDSYPTSKPSKKGKGEKLSKREQEATIAELQGHLNSFNDSASTPENAMQSIERDSDDDDDDSDQESEEE